MATKQVKGEWKVTNRGRKSWKRSIRLKGRTNREIYQLTNGNLYHAVPKQITKIIYRWEAVNVHDLPEEVRNEFLLWKMSQK